MKKRSHYLFLWLMTVIFSYIIFDYYELMLDLAVFTLRGNFFSDVSMIINDLLSHGITLIALFAVYFLINFHYRRHDDFDYKRTLMVYIPVILFGLVLHPFFLYFYYDWQSTLVFRILFALNIFLVFLLLFGLHTFVIWNNHKTNFLITVNFTLIISPLLLFIIFVMLIFSLYQIFPKSLLEENFLAIKGLDIIHLISALLVGSYPFITRILYLKLITPLENRGAKFFTLVIFSAVAIIIEIGFFVAIINDPTVAII